MSKRSVITAVLALAIAVPAMAERHHLLRDSFANGKSNSQAAKRRRFVEPDFAALKLADLKRGQRKKLERELSVQLFPDTTLLVKLDQVEKDLFDGIAWTGRIEGDALSSVVIAIKNDAMTATFTTLTHHYQVQPANIGSHEALELDRAEFPSELDPERTQLATTASVITTEAASSDAPGTWDVLVAYTMNARVNYGGTSAIESLITNAVAATNTSYANSNVTSRLRLVGTMEVNYADTSNGFSTTLSRFRGTSDGHMDVVHSERQTRGADVVALIIWGAADNACGIGYVMQTPGPNFASSAFNVTRYDCAVGNLSFAHELGHNFGLEHDRANSGGSVGSYPYAYGYQNPQGLFRDVMAYNCPTGCPRIQYFSNPDVLYNGYPTGVNYLASNAADNARALNNNANYIANWRQAPVVHAPVTFSDDPVMYGQTVIKATHILEIRSAINTRRAEAGLAAVNSWSNVAVGEYIYATHILELRTALPPAISAGVTFTPLSAGGFVQAMHVQELRELLL